MFTSLAQNGRGCLTSNFSMIGMFVGKRQFQISWKRTTSWCHSLHSFWGIALLLKSKHQWVRMGHLVINWVYQMRFELFSLILLGPFLYLIFGKSRLKSDVCQAQVDNYDFGCHPLAKQNLAQSTTHFVFLPKTNII